MERVTRLGYIIITRGNNNQGVAPVQPGASRSSQNICIGFFELNKIKKANQKVDLLWSG